MATSDYLEEAIIEHFLRNTAQTSPANVFCALYTVDPSDSGGGTEVTGNGYARQDITFGAPTDGLVQNSAEIAFPQATASWGTIVAIGVFDASTAGNLLYHGGLSVDKDVGENDTFKIAIGDLDITLT